MFSRSGRSLWALLTLGLLLISGGSLSAQDETRLLRFPHIHGNTVVFTYAGDLYTAPLSGGEAKRLTSHEGRELFARFSPDGRWIAFSGEYAGTRQVYVIPSGGGTPRQLTFYPDVGAMPPRGGFDHLVERRRELDDRHLELPFLRLVAFAVGPRDRYHAGVDAVG